MKVSISIPDRLVSLKFYKNIAILLLISWCVLSSYFLFLQNKTISSINTELTVISKNQNSMQIKDNGLSESEAYKEMYDNLKHSNDKILDTIYWSLGGLATAIIAMFGANIFFNFRFNKKEIESIEFSINARIEEIRNNILQDTQLRLDELIRTTRATNKDDFKELSHAQQSQIKSISESLNLKIDSIKNPLEERIKKCENNIDKNKSDIISSKDELLKDMDKEVKTLQIDIKKTESNIHFINKSYGNALIMQVRKGMIQLELNRSLEVTLSDIVDILKISNTVPWSYKNEFNTFLNKLPEGYELHKSEILSLIKDS